MTNLFNGLFDSTTTTVISISNFLICIGTALLLGLITALCARYKSSYSKSLFISLAILPTIVCIVIMMVNGNIGAGVAIAGAFALVRFRSSPGDAKQIALVFLSMATGLIVGMGYLAYAALFTVIVCLVLLLYTRITESRALQNDEKTLKILIPEDLNYTEVFEDIFAQYTSKHELTRVGTSNMGSLYKLHYDVTMKEVEKEKEMIDALRCRNGNLEIQMLKKELGGSVL